MPAPTDDTILQRPLNGHGDGGPRMTNGSLARSSNCRSSGNAQQRDGSVSPLYSRVGSPARSKFHWPLSPSASGDDTENASDDLFGDWGRKSFSRMRKQRENGTGSTGRGVQTNEPELAERTRSISKPASSQSEDDDTADEDGDPSQGGAPNDDEKQKVRKLSSAKMYELTASPLSLPLHSKDSYEGGIEEGKTPSRPSNDTHTDCIESSDEARSAQQVVNGNSRDEGAYQTSISTIRHQEEELYSAPRVQNGSDASRTPLTLRTNPISGVKKRPSSMLKRLNDRSPGLSGSRQLRSTPTPLSLDRSVSTPKSVAVDPSMPSPMPPTGLPAPPLSLSTWLQLELSSDRPAPRHHYHSTTSDIPYESSAVKIERLLNFLLLPPQLEQVLWFGALACLDAWLYSFTILPLRFLNALSILIQSWGTNVAKEIRYLGRFIYSGAGRMWHRRRRRSSAVNSPATNATQIPRGPAPSGLRKKDEAPISQDREDSNIPDPGPQPNRKRHGSATYRRHRRTKSTPSALRQSHKADLLKGLLILISCTILMRFDASRMYHGIRGQAAIKLYVIYNVLEVCDRLFSAIGQDVLECLFSKEALERKPDGRSKVLRPFWLFILALAYNLVHATALFYQVITLNVAVNSYSNALLTLLMSNQFVEIKSTVFKKFEKENLFQLTCADVVERFQLWLMLTIIAARNIIETGGFSLGSNNATAPFQSSGILPKAFTLFSPWTGQIMGPFLLVLGSEMLVDWIKHAYITKFNLTKPAIYGRFLDVLAKDYYSNAFADQNLTRRLGLPVIPLSCLFIRASVQTYHMFLATYMPMPIPSTATSLSVEGATSSPATTAALHHIDHIFRRALGRSTFGGGSSLPTGSSYFDVSAYLTTDDLIAFGTMLLFFLILFLLLLAFKLLLGMCLLSFARRRYKGMKEREQANDIYAEGKRLGGWGVVEVDEDKRRWTYMDDPEGLKRLREKEQAATEKAREGGNGEQFDIVERYKMVSKRIW